MMENPSSTKSLIRIVILSALIPALFLAIAWLVLEKSHKSYSWFNEGWYETFTLDNGMEVIVVPNHKIPAVSHMVWYRNGAIEDPAGKSGIAHFLEHLMFKGTKEFPDGQFSRLVEQNGGKENAFTSHDYTAYYQVISKDKLPLVMQLEANRMRGLELRQSQVDSELKVILEERKMRIDNNPRSLLKEQMDASLYAGTVYAIPVIGWQKEMEGLTREDAFNYYRQYYSPNNAVLVVSGDITAKELEPLARKYYGEIAENKKLPERAKVDLPEQIAAREVSLADKRVKGDEFWRAYVVPNYGNLKDSENFYTLTLLSRIMGEGTLSRFYRSLVINHKIASAAGASYSGVSWGPGEFTVYALPAEGFGVEDIRAAITAEIEKLSSTRVSEVELNLAKKSLIAEQTYAHEGLQGMGLIVGALAVINIEPEFVSSFPDRINAITAEQIQDAAQKFLKPENSVTGILKDE